MHSEFKLNNKTFTSIEDLKCFASQLLRNKNNDKVLIGKFILEWLDDKEYIAVKTSGSTGVPKVIKLHKEHVFNSAWATTSFFGLNQGTKALLCLSSEYIAGKMMLVRALISGWNLYTTNPDKRPLANIYEDFDFTAMVPYQLYHSLDNLHKVKKMIIGGGAVSKNMEDQIQQYATEIFATYGMTETISHVAVRALNGRERSTVYTALPNVEFSQRENDCLQILAPFISDHRIDTNDVVELLSPTSFKLLGRIDNVINTGGIKVHPEIIEEKLAPLIAEPFFITSEKDEVLGERVVLVIENRASNIQEIDKFKGLERYEKPKKIVFSPQFLYTETGKIRRKDTLRALGSS